MAYGSTRLCKTETVPKEVQLKGIALLVLLSFNSSKQSGSKRMIRETKDNYYLLARLFLMVTAEGTVIWIFGHSTDRLQES